MNDSRWIWQQPDWPHFRWQAERLAPLLRDCAQAQGRLLGMAGAVGGEFTAQSELDALLQNIVTSSAIEGEQLNVGSVRSSLARRLGLEQAGDSRVSARSEGLAELMLDATWHFQQPLTLDRLLHWQRLLFPSQDHDLLPRRIRVGALRGDEPMQVVCYQKGEQRCSRFSSCPDAPCWPHSSLTGVTFPATAGMIPAVAPPLPDGLATGRAVAVASRFRFSAALWGMSQHGHALVARKNVPTVSKIDHFDACCWIPESSSGRLDRPTVHFEAPLRDSLEQQLTAFLDWFEASRSDAGLDPLLRAGIAHFWFVTLHPFDDGNGRLTRAITDLALAQAERQSLRFYAMSTSILDDRQGYYRILEASQKAALDITPWLEWFLHTLLSSLQQALARIDRVLAKSRFWQQHRQLALSAEQIKVLNRLLDGGERGFEDGISAAQYQAVAKVSKATATRHLGDLLDKGCLVRLPGGGRSTRYRFARKAPYFECGDG